MIRKTTEMYPSAMKNAARIEYRSTGSRKTPGSSSGAGARSSHNPKIAMKTIPAAKRAVLVSPLPT